MSNWKEKLEDKVFTIQRSLGYRVFKFILPFLALLGLIFAIIDNRQSNADSEKIVSQLSTHYRGDFPDQIRLIAEGIENCRKSLVIAVDIPAYGVFSDPEAHGDYMAAILGKVLKSSENQFEKVVLICYAKGRREYEFKKQFGIPDENWNDTLYFRNYKKEKKKSREAWLEKLNRFKQISGSVEILTFKQLYEAVERKNMVFLSQLEQNKARCEVIELDKEYEVLPVYFWLFDGGQYAFMSFRSIGQNTKEVTISTKHPPIINYLKSIESDIRISESLKSETDNSEG